MTKEMTGGRTVIVKEGADSHHVPGERTDHLDASTQSSDMFVPRSVV
jgi:hypothetical protein